MLALNTSDVIGVPPPARIIAFKVATLDKLMMRSGDSLTNRTGRSAGFEDEFVAEDRGGEGGGVGNVPGMWLKALCL